MKLVIDIPEEIYQHYKKVWQKRRGSIPESCIAFGTPLPKGHGRLIDADAFIETMKDTSKRQKYKEVLIGNCLTVDDVLEAVIESLQNEGLANSDTPTIIEADKTE